MKARSLTLEYGLFILAFLLGLGLRLVHLGLPPLTDLELTWALQALDLARGAHPLIGAQPGYVLLTSLVFYVFGDGNYAARLVPALAGSGLILAPLLYRRWTGRWAAVVLAWLLAFAPILVAASRQADGLILAISFSVLAAGFLMNRVYSWAGIFAGLALLGGTGIWEGVVIVGIALLWHALFTPRPVVPEPEEINPGPAGVRVTPRDERYGPVAVDWARVLPWLGGTLLMVGVLLPLAFLVPSGISALGTSLTAYLSGWVGATRTAGLPMLLSLADYVPLALVFGGVGMVSAIRSRDHADLFLMRWALIGLLVALVYPARTPLDLAWALVPLWALSARQMVRMIVGFSGDRVALAGQIVLVVILLVFTWLNFVHLSSPGTGEVAASLLTLKVSIYAALVLLVLVTLMVGWGWMWDVAANGLLIGVGLFLTAFTLSGAWHATYLSWNPSGEALRESPYISQGDLLYQTVLQMDHWNTPAGTSLDLSVVGVDSPALRWLLRDYVGVRFVDVVPAGTSPSMIITPVEQQPQLAASYSGQDFNLEQSANWHALAEDDWSRWWVVHTTPVTNRAVILWVRTDLFPGAAKASVTTP